MDNETVTFTVIDPEVTTPILAVTESTLARMASILTNQGTSSVRQFIASVARLPEDSSGLERSVAQCLDYWRYEVSQGFTMSSLAEADEADPSAHDAEDRIVIGWLLGEAGVPPTLLGQCLDLSWPSSARSAQAAAARYYPAGAEHSEEKEEIASAQVSRWLRTIIPFAGSSLIPRAELYGAYQAWAKTDGGARMMRASDFYDCLREAGCEEKRTSAGRFFGPARK